MIHGSEIAEFLDVALGARIVLTAADDKCFFSPVGESWSNMCYFMPLRLVPWWSYLLLIPPGKQPQNELEHHHFLGKLTISTGHD